PSPSLHAITRPPPRSTLFPYTTLFRSVMIELARKYGEGPISLKSIAEDKNLSAHYLEQLAAPLRNAGLVRSVRGAYGGYILADEDRESTRLNSSHVSISYAVFCLKKKN